MKKSLLIITMLLVNMFVGYANNHVDNVKYDFVVATDGTGNYTTVQAAINAIPDFRKAGPTRIFIKRGVYKEKIVIPETKQGVQLFGEEGTIITYDDFANKPNIFGENKGTSGSSTIYVFCPDFLAENITFENSSGPVGQAVAVQIGGDRAIFRHCRFLGFQDTLYTFGENTREYFEDCYIEGTVDFIFGKATAVFVRCHVHSKSAGYVTAPATPQGVAYGYVFYDCKLTADKNVKDSSVYLSRPWRPYGQTVYIRCHMDSHIKPEGWNNWDNPANEQTAFYAEYQSTGDGANPNQRVSWSHQLTDISKYDIQQVLAGNDGWNPLTVGR
ncbi:MAG: hypothetical protein IIT85_01525 [Prevotella sp.]|nr:hypothetical protein [Prevotella sp.]